MEKLLEALKTQEKLVEKEKECLGRSEDLGVFCWVLGCCDVRCPRRAEGAVLPGNVLIGCDSPGPRSPRAPGLDLKSSP